MTVGPGKRQAGVLMVYLLALCIGVVAGLRTLTAPTFVSWAARLGWLDLQGTWLGFLGYRWTPWIMTVLALGELIVDKLPSTPSRKAPSGLVPRILSGAVSSAAVATPGGVIAGGIIAGIVGAVIGTFGGYALRAKLAAAFRRDRPAALIEDAIAITCGWLIVSTLR